MEICDSIFLQPNHNKQVKGAQRKVQRTEQICEQTKSVQTLADNHIGSWHSLQEAEWKICCWSLSSVQLSIMRGNFALWDMLLWLFSTMLVDWNLLLPNSTHLRYWKGPVLFFQLTWMQMMGRKGGQEDGWSPLCPAGRKERERHVCWVIHSLTLSFHGFPPSSSVCTLNPLITK